LSDLVVHQLPGAWGLPSISSFCLKLDAYLRIVNVPHRTVVDATPFAGPKRKLPWTEHEGKRIGDSGFIIDYFEQRFGVRPNATRISSTSSRGSVLGTSHDLAMRRLDVATALAACVCVQGRLPRMPWPGGIVPW
jgi:hypothetical protein